MKRLYFILLITFFIIGVILVLHEYRVIQPTEIIDPNLYTIYPGEGIGAVKFNMTKEEIITQFGEPDETGNKGMSLLYKSKGFTLVVYPKSGLQSITCFTKALAPPFSSFKDFPGSMDNGIKMGANKTQIIAACGSPDKEIIKEKYQTNLTYEKLGIQFILLKDELIYLSMQPVKTDTEN